MDCVDAKSMMESYVSDRLAADAKAGLEEHLAACEGCRLEVELVRAMGSASPKSPAANGDEWTIDRIFGAGATRAPEASPAPPGPVTSRTDAEPPPADSVASLAPEPLAPPAPEPAAPDPVAPPAAESLAPEPVAPPAPLESAASPAGPDYGVDALFENVPTPPPPEPASAAPVSTIAGAAPTVAAPPIPDAAAEAEPVSPAKRGAAGAPAGPEDKPADLQLESIQASSIAEPSPGGARKPPADGAGRRTDPKPIQRSPQGRAAAATGSSWDFEPADAKPDGKPPEGSLFFAEEALTRHAAARQSRSSTLRTGLWAAGSVLGVALLALSIWIALAMQRPSQAPPPAPAQSQVPAGAESAPPAEPPPASNPQGSPDDGTIPEATAVPDAGASAPPPPSDPRVIEAATVRPPASTTGPSSKGIKAAPKAPPPAAKSLAPPAKAAPSATKGVAPGPAVAKSPASPSKQAVTTTERALPLGGSAASEKVDVAAAPRAIKPEPPPVSDAVEKAEERAKPSPAVVTPPPAPAASAPASSQSGAASAATPGSSSPAPPPAAEPGPPVERPIDRLHTATVTAAQNSDLNALRKLRDAWKSLVRSSVGPDRARGKRELADCLWEIQSLTGRGSDKKDALLAYRDYVLTAPAGGADARTVSRMRQLEDAMSESR